MTETQTVRDTTSGQAERYRAITPVQDKNAQQHFINQLNVADTCGNSSKFLYNGSKYGLVIEYNSKNVLEAGLEREPNSREFVIPLEDTVLHKIKHNGKKELFLYKSDSIETENDLTELAHCIPIRSLAECGFQRILFQNQPFGEILYVSVAYLKTLL